MHLSKGATRHIEDELRHADETMAEYKHLSKRVSRKEWLTPTERARLLYLEQLVSTLNVLHNLPHTHLHILQARYTTNTPASWHDIAHTLGVSVRQATIWRDKLFTTIADRLAWR